MHLFRFSWLLPLFLFQNLAFSQIVDDFSDGDFTQNPSWQGDAANFKISSGELQLNATTAGQSALSVGGNITDSTVWNLRFRLTFAPSAQNLLRIYLLADQPNFAAANGYFLEAGENGSADALRLYRQDGAAAKTLLATGQPGLVATNPDIQLRVKRNKSGNWEVLAAAGNGTLQPQCTASDATYTGGTDRYFGFLCLYTVTNAARFFFDNISILPDVPDTKPPVLLSAQALDATQVTAVFDETLDSLSAVSPANYAIVGIGQPLTASLLSGKNAVSLTLAAPLATGNYTLQTTGLKDIVGNISAVQSAGFQYVKIDPAAEFDVVINEIMADPTPSVGLPEVEWLELYNRSTKTIDLASLRLTEGSSSAVALPAYLMQPGTYVVLAAPANASALRPVSADTVLIAPISSTALNNDGDLLVLSTATGLTVDRVEYSLDWHTAPGKSDGGWSLELINPNLPCSGSANWQSCPILPGGTPGKANASLNLLPDTEAPKLIDAFPESPTEIRLRFTEGLDAAAATDLSAYRISPARAIASAGLYPDDRKSVRLLLAEPLNKQTVYAAVVSAPVQDCSGNLLVGKDTVLIGLPEQPDEQDIVLNEIMADPSPTVGLPEVEWLELYNRSAKIIDLSTLRIAVGNGAGAALPKYLMLPGTYTVLAAPANVAVLRLVSASTVLAAPFSSSALTNEGTLLTLSSTSGLIVSRVEYRLDWHTDPGKGDGGWSLERINPELFCLGRVNWKSCLVKPGGTPGKVNASFSSAPDTEAPRLLDIFPESPTEIRLHFGEGLDIAAAADLSSYGISPDRAFASAGLYPDERNFVRLLLTEPLSKQTLYTLTVSAPLKDCSGNFIAGTDTLKIGLPEKPGVEDIVVNEVMFNPAPNGSRYVEFYNRSQKVFDWSEFFIANNSGSTSTVQVKPRKLALPGQYEVFAPNSLDVLERFDNVVERNVVEQTLPSLDDKAGNLTLYWAKNGQMVVLDSFDYSEDLHNGLFNISEREGVALERIRTSGPTNDPANWTSAAPNLTGAPGSPTLPNSQRLDSQSPNADDGLIQLSRERLSPDLDGFEDFLDIRYALPREGYAATMTIFDSEGVPLRRLARQQLIGTEGTLRWDGDLDDGTMARPGIYVLFLEIFSPTGEVRREKRAVAVVGRW